jgi:hypothetical protein
MPDAKRSEIFTPIPSREAGDAAVTFVLPDSFSNSKRVCVGNMNRNGGPTLAQDAKREQANGKYGEAMLG